MPSLRDYVTETEQWADTPRTGDDFDIEIAPDELAEGVVVESDGKHIVLELSESAVTALEQRGMLSERIGRYGAVGSSRGMGFTLGEQEKDPQDQAKDDDLPFEPDVDASDRDEFGNLIKHRARHLARQGMRQAMDVKQPDPVDEDSVTRMLELAGLNRHMDEEANTTDPLAAKAAALAPVGTMSDPGRALTVDEGVMSEIDIDLQSLADRGDEEDLIAALEGDLGPGTATVLQNMLEDLKDELASKGMTDVINDDDKMIEILWDKIVDEYGGRDLDEAAAKPAKPAAKGAKPAAKGRDRSDLIPPNEIVSPPDGATAPGPGEPPHTNDAIEYNRRLGLPEQDTADDDRPLWQRAWDKVQARVKSASQDELDRRKADNRAAMVDRERAAGTHGPVNEAFDQRKADAYNRAVQAGHSPEEAEKMAGIRDEDQNDYEIDVDGKMKRLAVRAATAPGQVQEAEYQGRKVALGKPTRGDVKKFKVYVKDPKTGNVKKVNFGHGGKSAKRAGEKTLRIKKSNPARRRSFRARHNCDNPGPRTKARYWSCRAW